MKNLRVLLTGTLLAAAVATAYPTLAQVTCNGSCPLPRGAPTEVQIGGQFVTVEVVNGLAMYQGDIVLGKLIETESGNTIAGYENRGIGITGNQYRWEDGVIGFQIDHTVTPNQAGQIQSAIAHWEANTDATFVERPTGDRIVFRQSGQTGVCTSSVGRQGGAQYITLDPDCNFGSIVHEIGHAVGMWHEQSREDRNAFVLINYGNICPGREHNFDQRISNGDDIGDYDYGSIMHYGACFFASGSQPTIEPLQSLPPGVSLGQRNGLSAGDIEAGRFLLGTGGDTDGDGVYDLSDNCTQVPNADQRDTDNDGYGNICDGDFNNDLAVNAIDLGLFRDAFFTTGPDEDLNGDGIVNALDLGLFRSLYFQPPGPSGVGNIAPAAPILTAITDGAGGGSFFVDFDGDYNLEWDDPTGAATYNLIRTLLFAPGANPVYFNDLTVSFLNENNIAPGEYVYQVEACTATGLCSDLSSQITVIVEFGVID